MKKMWRSAEAEIRPLFWSYLASLPIEVPGLSLTVGLTDLTNE